LVPIPVTCESSPQASAIFGAPRAVGSLELAEHGNRFTNPTHCASSRFTDFPDAVRHELAIAAE
jgi:hypothetical protein